jgi:hypothetical protein
MKPDPDPEEVAIIRVAIDRWHATVVERAMRQPSLFHRVDLLRKANVAVVNIAKELDDMTALSKQLGLPQ